MLLIAEFTDLAADIRFLIFDNCFPITVILIWTFVLFAY